MKLKGNMMISKRNILTLVVTLWAGSANAEFFYFFGADEPTDAGLANTTTDSNSVSVALAEAAWEAQVRSLYGANSISDFNTTAANVSVASGSSAVQTAITNNENNINLSNPTTPTGAGSDHSNATSGLATFNAGAQTPGFTIQQHETVGGNHSGVFFNDVPNGKSAETAAGWQNKLSIGKFNGFPSASGLDTAEYDNDDFTFEITGGDTLYAFAFHMINNKKNSSNAETLTVVTDGVGGTSNTILFGDNTNDGTNGMNGVWVDASGNIVPANTPGATEITGANDDIPGYVGDQGEGLVQFNGSLVPADFVQESFVGILTDDINDIFSFLNFNEGSSVNDIGIFDFRFATVPVPLPAGIWLLFSGLIALFGLGRKPKTAKV